MATVLPPDMSSVATVVLDRRDRARPDGPSFGGTFVVSIDGAVSVGKSTTASLLAGLLAAAPACLDVRIVSTDGFLFPNRVLDARGLTMRKGFPESYDHDSLVAFLHSARDGQRQLRVPVYSHETYDVLDEHDVFEPPDVLVVEGLHTGRLAGSGAVDLTTFVDAAVDDVERWYVERFLELTASPEGFYTAFAGWDGDSLEEFARGVWSTINGPNLAENILANREIVDLVITKGADHSVTAVTLRD